DTAQIVSGIRNAIDAIIANPPKGIEIIPSISEIKDTQERAEAAVRVAISTGYLYAVSQMERGKELGELVKKGILVPVSMDKIFGFSKLYITDHPTNEKRVNTVLSKFEESKLVLKAWSTEASKYQEMIGLKINEVYLIDIGKFPFALSPEIYENQRGCKIVIKMVLFVDSLVNTFRSLLPEGMS
ncbi:MAG: hypothetical protein ACP5NO_08720, partial [Thermoplasmata archaeon]